MIRHLVLTCCVAFAFAVPSLHAQQFLGKTLNDWAAQLKTSSDAKQRRNAAFSLGKMGKRALAALPALKSAFDKEKDAKVRDTILYSLGEISRDAAAADADAAARARAIAAVRDANLEPLFIAAANDPDAHVRRSAVFALGCLANKSDATRAALDNALNDREAVVRQNAAWAMGRYGLDALPLLKKALGDPDSFVKRDAASALLQMNDADKVHELLKDLLPLCRDTNSEVRRAALNVLVQIVDAKDREAIPPLRVAMEDRDIENRRNAALALTNIGGEETKIALPVLLEAIKNGDDDVRSQSVLAIRNVGPAAASAVGEMVRLLRDDKSAKMREYAALALGGIGPASETAVPLLVQKVQDAAEERAVRTECAMALARIGQVPAAVAAVPDLLSVLGNPQHDSRVRERVMWALRVHNEALRTMKGTKETFVRILKEPANNGNRMLRYDAAYMLGMIWQQQAPDATLDVLAEFLKDGTIQVFDKTASSVGPTGNEVVSGAASVKERGKGDGRVMAVDALLMMGPTRYAGRPDIMEQLRILAADNQAYEPLQKKSAQLLKAAK